MTNEEFNLKFATTVARLKIIARSLNYFAEKNIKDIKDKQFLFNNAILLDEAADGFIKLHKTIKNKNKIKGK